MDFPASGSTGQSTENGKGADRSLPASLGARASFGAWSKCGGIIPTHSKWWETDQEKQPQMGMLMGLGGGCIPVLPFPVAPHMGDRSQGKKAGRKKWCRASYLGEKYLEEVFPVSS